MLHGCEKGGDCVFQLKESNSWKGMFLPLSHLACESQHVLLYGGLNKDKPKGREGEPMNFDERISGTIQACPNNTQPFSII
jgi:hypothetical protein